MHSVRGFPPRIAPREEDVVGRRQVVRILSILDVTINIAGVVATTMPYERSVVHGEEMGYAVRYIRKHPHLRRIIHDRAIDEMTVHCIRYSVFLVVAGTMVDSPVPHIRPENTGFWGWTRYPGFVEVAIIANPLGVPGPTGNRVATIV